MITVGIVGLGKIAKDRHVPAIEASGRLTLHSTADPAAALPSITHFPDIDSMLAVANPPDAISICTPPQARYAIARDALARGRHVLLEKPPCQTVQEVEDLRRQAEQTGQTLFCAWHSRFAPAVVPAREWLSSRVVRRVRIDWREDVRVWHPNQTWIWETGGFGAFDPGINALSIATAVLPGPLVLGDALLRVPENCATPASAELVLTDGDGTDVRASFDFLQEGPPTWTIEAETDDGSVLLSQGGGRLTIDGTDVPLGPTGEYDALYARFAELIDAGGIDADTTPLQIVADALVRGRTSGVPALDASYGCRP